MSDDDGHKNDVSEEDLRAYCAGQIRLASEHIDRAIWAMSGDRVRVYAQGQSFVGKALAYDGARIVLQHDTDTCTVLWLKSGVVLSEAK